MQLIVPVFHSLRLASVPFAVKTGGTNTRDVMIVFGWQTQTNAVDTLTVSIDSCNGYLNNIYKNTRAYILYPLWRIVRLFPYDWTVLNWTPVAKARKKILFLIFFFSEGGISQGTIVRLEIFWVPFFPTVTLVWPRPLQVASDFPQIFDFVLKCFNLTKKKNFLKFLYNMYCIARVV